MTDRWRLVSGKELYDMKADPGQRTDVASKYPQVVRDLCDSFGDWYDDWWADISDRFDENGRFLAKHCEILISADHENPCRLHREWHDPREAIGFWRVVVAAAGEYEFTFRRWPISSPIKHQMNKPLGAGSARLRIAGVDVTKPIPEDAAAVSFRVPLRAGKACLQAQLIDNKGDSRGVDMST